MTSKGYQTIYLVLLLSYYIQGVFCDESKEELQPKYEYIQIFKSIPALFEYLLNALEERPEILEKSDITVFTKRHTEASGTNEFESSDSGRKTDKRDVDGDEIRRQTEYKSNNDEGKRDAHNSKDVLDTTVAYEYGNSNVNMKGLDDLESDKAIFKTLADNRDGNTLSDKKKTQSETQNRIKDRKRSVLSKLDNGNVHDMLRNYGDVYLGFDHLFGLDLKPEDIEERILTTEKLLEEHNSKKDK